MWRISLANLRSRPGRFVTTLLAVVLGTGFLAGALVLRDSLGSALEESATAGLQGVDAAVLPGSNGGQGRVQAQALRRTQSVPPVELGKVQGVPGVAGAAGVATGAVGVNGRDGSPSRKGLAGSAWIEVPQLNPYRIITGAAPTAAGQIAMSADAASDLDLSLGSQVDLTTTSGPATAVLVGLTAYGSVDAKNGNGDVLVAPADAFAYLNAGQPGYDAIYVASSGQVPTAKLVADVQAAVGAGFEVESGDDLRDEQAGAAGGLASVLGIGLQAFAYVALIVGGFIIYNTFTTVVTQRVREFALLRAVGASTRQVSRAVRVEAFVVGVVASSVGFVLGVVLASVLFRLVPQFRSLVGGGISVRVNPWSATQVLVSGTIITVICALVPAFRAARTRPVAALRAVSVDRTGASRVRAVTGVVLLGAGVAALLLGAAVSQALLVGLGAFVSFVGVVVGGPVLAAGFSRLLGALVRPLHRQSLVLAVHNLRRNSSRTATTANALVIGVFMVVFVTAAGGAVRDFASAQLSKISGADITLSAGGQPLPANLIDQVNVVPGVTGTVPVFGNFARSVGNQSVGAVDFARAQQVIGLKTTSGNLDALADDQIASATFPGGGGRGGRGADRAQVGDRVTVTFANGTTRQLTVAASYEFSISVPAQLLMNASAARAVQPDLQPTSLGVSVVPGEESQVQRGLERVVAGYSDVDVAPGNVLAQLVRTIFNGLISGVNALLGVAVVIALFGIANTLILSVIERTRELGLLRAVGMTRGQLRGMIRTEAVMVASLGTGVGMLFGLAVAWALTRPLFASGGSISWPWREMGLILVLGLALGSVASLIPAIRASRLVVMEAIRDE